MVVDAFEQGLGFGVELGEVGVDALGCEVADEFVGREGGCGFEGFGERGVDELGAEVFVVVACEGKRFGEEVLVERFGEFFGVDVGVVVALERGARFDGEGAEVVVEEDSYWGRPGSSRVWMRARARARSVSLGALRVAARSVSRVGATDFSICSR